jgi:hypothetical protein
MLLENGSLITELAPNNVICESGPDFTTITGTNVTIQDGSGNSVTLNKTYLNFVNSENTASLLQLTPSTFVINSDCPLTIEGTTLGLTGTPLTLDSTTIAIGNGLTTTTLNGQVTFESTTTFPNEVTFGSLGQVTFETPPHAPTPIIGNDVATKGYVDTLVGNYGGNGLALYFNVPPSVNPITGYPFIALVGALEQTLIPMDATPPAAYYTLQSPALGTDLKIASFTTPVGFPSITTVPAGLWNMLIYGYASAALGQLYYHFHLSELKADNSVVLIATSGFSSDVNATSSVDPDTYHASLAIVTPYTLDSLASRLVVDIYTTGTGMGPSVTLNTLFGGTYYSFVTTSLSGGTSILTTNNTWTGENVWEGAYSEFTSDVYAPTQVKGTANNLVATCELVNLKLEDYASILTSNTFDEPQTFTLGVTAQSVGTNNVDAQTAVSTLTIGETASSVILKGGSDNLIAVNSAVNMTVKDQTALSNNSNVANTKYVDSAISALSTVYGAKASANTWTSLQTFTTGVSTTSVTSATAGSAVSLFSSTTGTITMGTSSNSNRIGNLTISNVGINPTTTTSGMYLGGTQTGATAELGLGVAVGRTAPVNIGISTCAVNVNGVLNTTTPSTNISTTQVPTTEWVNTYFVPLTTLGNYLTTATAASTYATIASLGSYLTTATAASTYATIASLGSYLTTATAASTYATITSLGSYLTTAAAASTYATIASLSSYLTTATAATTYAPLASPTLTGTISLNGTSNFSAAGSANFNNGLTLAADKRITFSTNTANPSPTSALLGSVYTGSYSGASAPLTTGVDYVVSSITLVPIGIYVATGCSSITSSTAGAVATTPRIQIKNFTALTYHACLQLPTFTVPVGDQKTSMSCAGIVEVLAVSTIQLVVNAVFSSPAIRNTGDTTNFNFRLVRIG